jgi:hypothetical protein
MKEYYEVVKRSKTELVIRPYELTIKYSRLEWLYFPVLMSLMACGISLWLVIDVSQERMSILAKVSLLGGVAVLLSLLFWHVIRNGLFVLYANYDGLFYREIEDKSSLVFIRWEAVKQIAIYDNGARELEIETIFENSTKLPAPCNGVSFVKENGRLAISLYLGTGLKTPDIMSKIDDLKSSKREREGLYDGERR